jgi:hypothetical protein
VTAPYIAYATLADGTASSVPFECSLRAVEHAGQVFREGGACFVVRLGSRVIFNTHESLLAVLTHTGRSAEPTLTETALREL